MNVYEKLMNVQTKLKAPKGQFNSFGKYNYRSCEDILEGLKPLLAEFKAVLNLTDTIYQIGDRFYIKATAIFIDVEQGEKIEVSALAREDETKKGMDLAQVTGSVSSYARKYALNGLFCIDDTKDSDVTNKHGKDNDSKTFTNIQQQTETTLKCERCKIEIKQAVSTFSKQYFKGHEYCQKCQKEVKEEVEKLSK